MTPTEMRARGFSEADIIHATRLQAAERRKPKAPTPAPGRAREAKTPKDFILNLLRGGGL